MKLYINLNPADNPLRKWGYAGNPFCDEDDTCLNMLGSGVTKPEMSIILRSMGASELLIEILNERLIDGRHYDVVVHNDPGEVIISPVIFQ